ncbi:unnamed protein product [marine sediment metagenome]|uniref:Uncharacterized protein n=1 Tax=marine sediment metagenome TaxID=412755 RepID=X1BDT5_9ZZZZ
MASPDESQEDTQEDLEDPEALKLTEKLEALKLKDSTWGTKATKLEKLRGAIEYHKEHPDANIKDIASQFGIPKSTLSLYFKKMGIIRGQEKISEAAKVIEKAAKGEAILLAEGLSNIMVRSGSIIATEFSPLVQYAIKQGKTVEIFTREMATYYEGRVANMAYTAELEAKNLELENLVSKLRFLAAPGLKYALRSKIVEDFTNKLVRARMRGARIKIDPAVRV